MDAVFDELADQSPGLRDALVEDFRRFIESGKTDYPNYFGRQSIYNFPVEAERAHLCHMHLALPPRTFSKGRSLMDRTNPRDPEQDACLVYCEHYLWEGRVLLLNILYPDAHGKARNKRLMRYLAREAQAFQDS
ncbi:hypothetical protein GY26_15990 [Gammaproteobacteria bacterium MFB021]|nr:hypothetical protein GY26_15990 [Gammaproteobacteria bacterium MFB021]